MLGRSQQEDELYAAEIAARQDAWVPEKEYTVVGFNNGRVLLRGTQSSEVFAGGKLSRSGSVAIGDVVTVEDAHLLPYAVVSNSPYWKPQDNPALPIERTFEYVAALARVKEGDMLAFYVVGLSHGAIKVADYDFWTESRSGSTEFSYSYYNNVDLKFGGLPPSNTVPSNNLLWPPASFAEDVQYFFPMIDSIHVRYNVLSAQTVVSGFNLMTGTREFGGTGGTVVSVDILQGTENIANWFYIVDRVNAQIDTSGEFPSTDSDSNSSSSVRSEWEVERFAEDSTFVITNEGGTNYVILNGDSNTNILTQNTNIETTFSLSGSATIQEIAYTEAYISGWKKTLYITIKHNGTQGSDNGFETIEHFQVNTGSGEVTQVDEPAIDDWLAPLAIDEYTRMERGYAILPSESLSQTVIDYQLSNATGAFVLADMFAPIEGETRAWGFNQNNLLSEMPTSTEGQEFRGKYAGNIEDFLAEPEGLEDTIPLVLLASPDAIPPLENEVTYGIFKVIAPVYSGGLLELAGGEFDNYVIDGYAIFSDQSPLGIAG